MRRAKNQYRQLGARQDRRAACRPHAGALDDTAAETGEGLENEVRPWQTSNSGW